MLFTLTVIILNEIKIRNDNRKEGKETWIFLIFEHGRRLSHVFIRNEYNGRRALQDGRR